MGIQNVNNAAPKTAADFNADDLKNADEKKFQNTIFDLDSAIRANVTIDGKLEDGEEPKIRQWLSLIDNIFYNVSDSIKEKCEQAVDKALALIQDLCREAGIKKYDNEKGIVFENDEAEYYSYTEEPDETDADYDPFAYIKAMSNKELQDKLKELRVPERKFNYIEPTSKVEDIKRKYNNCFNPITPKGENRNRMIASSLENFLSYCYAEDVLEELQKISSSVKTDGKWELNNIEEQIRSQIHFYEELADRENAANQQAFLESATNMPKKPSEQFAKKWGNTMHQVVANDPMANAAKIVNPD